MTNNDLLRLISVSFDMDNKKLLSVFALGGLEISTAELESILSQDQSKVREFPDIEFSSFLNGLITFKRGPSDKGVAKPDDKLTYNMIFKKIKIAMGLHNEDIIQILASVGIDLPEFELSAYLRRENHKNYRPIRAQLLRNFIFAIGEVQGL